MDFIFGIGNDIVETERVIKACEKETFIKKCFTEKEQELIHKKKKSAANNFAGKEAVAKSFGTGFSNIKLIEIEILRNEKGAPYVVLHGKAKEFAKENHIKKIHISLSDTETLSSAYAVAEEES